MFNLDYTNTSVDSAASTTTDAIMANENAGKQFSVYPDPAKNMVTIQLGGKADFILTDQSGKILLTQTIESKGVIDVSAMSTGLYFLKNSTTGDTQK